MNNFHRKMLTLLAKVLAVAVITTIAFAPGFAQKKTKPPQPPPPPDPIALSLVDGLNAILATGTSLELFSETSTGGFVQSTWTEEDYGGTRLVFADVDGDSSSEIVVARVCTTETGEYGHFLNVFKNGVTGLWETSYYDRAQWMIDPSTYVNIRAFDMDERYPGDEILLQSSSSLTLFFYDHDTQTIQKGASFDLASFGQEISGKTLTYWNFDVSDIDHDDVPDIVLAAHFRDGTLGPDHEYLIGLEYNPNAGFSEKFYLDLYDAATSTGDAIGSFMVSSIRLADCDGDHTPELWLAGWQNHWEFRIPEFDHKVFAWDIVNEGENWKLVRRALLEVEGTGGTSHNYSLTYISWSYLSTGDLDRDGKDEVVLFRRDPLSSNNYFPDRVEVFKPFDSSDTGSVIIDPAPVAVKEYWDRHTKSVAVMPGRLFVLGFIPPARKGSSQFFFDIYDAPQSEEPFQFTLPIFSTSGIGEKGALAVGSGRVSKLP